MLPQESAPHLLPIPGDVELLAALLGGSPGALLAQGLFRHKTRKQPKVAIETFAGKTLKLLLGFSQWDRVEGAQLAFLFEGPLLWLGLVRLGELPGEGRAFQLTTFGQHALGFESEPVPDPPEQKFVVQGDFDVLVPRDAPFYARFQLERAAERVQWDRMSTYRLTRESITRLLRRNATIDQVLAFLKRMARPPFPRNVEYTLREWAAKYGEITLRRAAILHTRDRNLLAELQRHVVASAALPGPQAGDPHRARGGHLRGGEGSHGPGGGHPH